MYRELNTDLFSVGADGICNTINTVGAMGRGIALEFKTRYPTMFRAYRDACYKHLITPGTCWTYRTKQVPPITIFNLAVKQDWKQPARIEWISSSIEDMVAQATELKIKHIALPFPGSMNGWLPFPLVRDIVRRLLQDRLVPFDISVCELRPEIIQQL